MKFSHASVHELKILPEYYWKVKSGLKNFEAWHGTGLKRTKPYKSLVQPQPPPQGGVFILHKKNSPAPDCLLIFPHGQASMALAISMAFFFVREGSIFM